MLTWKLLKTLLDRDDLDSMHLILHFILIYTLQAIVFYEAPYN